MAKKERRTRKIGGPFLAAAVFCESILEDTGGKLSAVGIMDGVTFYLANDAPKDVPSKTQPLSFLQKVLIVFRSGDAPGKHMLRLVAETPDGKRHKPSAQEINLSSVENGGCNVKTNVGMSVIKDGVHWLDVILDGKRMTRMPLNIKIQRLPPPETSLARPKSK